MNRRAGWHAVDAAVVAVLAGIVYASLARRGWVDCSRWAVSLLRESPGIGPGSGADLLGNVFAYWLLGGAVGLAWAARRPGGTSRLGAALVAGAWVTVGGTMLSLSMEAAQACLAGRVSSWLDVVANTGGTALGWFSARAAVPAGSALVRRGGFGRGNGPLLAIVSMAVFAWILAETAPWIPTPHPAMIAAQAAGAWDALLHAPLEPWRLAQQGGCWLAVGGALALPPLRPIRALPLLAAVGLGVIGWQLALPRMTPPVPETTVSVAASLVALALAVRLGRRTCALLALTGAIVAMTAWQLEPGYGPPADRFIWRLVLLAGDPINGIEQACRFGGFAATIVAAGAVLGGSPLAWAALPPALLAGTEWLQMNLPGHSAELSPPVIALACVGFATALLRRARRSRG